MVNGEEKRDKTGVWVGQAGQRGVFFSIGVGMRFFFISFVGGEALWMVGWLLWV